MGREGSGTGGAGRYLRKCRSGGTELRCRCDREGVAVRGRLRG
jgi:hypothetical protein